MILSTEKARLMLRERSLRAALYEASERADDAEQYALEHGGDADFAAADEAEAAEDAIVAELAEVRERLKELGICFAARVELTK